MPEADLLLLLLKNLPDHVRSFVLHHASGESYMAYRRAARNYEERQRLFGDSKFGKPLSQVFEMSGAQSTEMSRTDLSDDPEGGINAMGQTPKCGKCGSRKHSTSDCTTDLSKVRCFMVISVLIAVILGRQTARNLVVAVVLFLERETANRKGKENKTEKGSQRVPKERVMAKRGNSTKFRKKVPGGRKKIRPGGMIQAGMIRLGTSRRGPLMVGLMHVGTSLSGSMSQNMIGSLVKMQVNKRVMLEV